MEGDVPILEWVSRLEKLGYEGSYELELFGPTLESIAYRDRLKHCRLAIGEIVTAVHEQTKLSI